VTFISVLIALVVEQFRPLPLRNPVYSAALSLTRAIETHMNAGERSHGIVGWCMLIVPMLIVVSGLHWWLAYRVWPIGLMFSVVILYFTLGFRQFSHPFTEIQLALEAGNLGKAREVLGSWMREGLSEFSADRMSGTEIARHAIERAILMAHRHVFGVFFWFIVLGPAGAICYRLAEHAGRTWIKEAPGAFGLFAQTAYQVIDYVPVRMTAIGFAIVGNFEDAMYAWRNHAGHWHDAIAGILLSSGGGALGVRLGGRYSGDEVGAPAVGPTEFDPNATTELPPGIQVEPGHMRSAVGMVWRAMVLWLLLLLLLSIAHSMA
jgi:adenosylcobinamide-phosphate synthase